MDTVTILPSGNVGIGTTNPQAVIQYSTNSNAAVPSSTLIWANQFGLGGGYNTWANLLVSSPDGNGCCGSVISSYWDNTSNYGILSLGTMGYSGVQHTVNIMNGDVGIGTTAPIRPLTIAENGNAGELSFVSASGTASTGYINVSDINGNNPGSFTIRGLSSSGGAGANLSAINLDANTVYTPGTFTAGAFTGTLNAANVSAGTFGSNTGSGTYNFPANIGAYAYTPGYAAWNYYGVGAGGAAIYNDNSGYDALMIVGNNSAGGNREVHVWDDLTVNNNLTVDAHAQVNGNLTIAGSITRPDNTGAAIAPGNGTNTFYADTENFDNAIGNATVMTISGGDVGIGTTAPSAALTIAVSDSNVAQSNAVVSANSFNNPGYLTGNGAFASFFGYQNANNTSGGGSYAAALGLDAAYNGTNWSRWDGYIQPEALLVGGGTGTSTNSMGFHFLTSGGLNTNGTPGTYTPYEAMTILDNGNVGIGTTNPGSLLDIGGTGTLRISGSGTLSGYGGVEMANVSGFGLQTASLNYAFNGSNGTTNFVTINSSGNVGIGTTNPAELNPTARLALDSGSNTYLTIDAPLADQSSITLGDQSDGQDMILYRPAGTQDLRINSNGTGGVGDVVTFAHNGDVGIGNSSPGTLLEVGSGGSTGKLEIDSADTSYGEFQIGNPTSGGEASMAFVSGMTSLGDSPASTNGTSFVWDIGAGNYGIAGNKFGIGNEAYGGVILTVQSNGNVGIGTTAPDATLDVNGHVDITGTTPTFGACGSSPVFNGGSTDSAGTFVAGSGAGTSCIVDFASAFTTPPACVITAHGVGQVYELGTSGVYAQEGFWLSSVGTTYFEVNTETGLGGMTFTYVCIGN